MKQLKAMNNRKVRRYENRRRMNGRNGVNCSVNSGGTELLANKPGDLSSMSRTM